MLEGDWSPHAIVFVEFPSRNAALRWQRPPEYAEELRIRAGSGLHRRLICVEGTSYPPIGAPHKAPTGDERRIQVSTSTKTRQVVDTHRHAFGSAMAKRMAQAGLYDPSAPFPQAGADDIIFYREFIDLDFAMHQQRQSGVTHTIISNGGEIPWIAGDILKTDVASALDHLTDDYLDTMQKYPGEFSMMANAHALDESCRPAVERAIEQHRAKAISISSSYGDGVDRTFLDSPRAEWLWEFATDKRMIVHVHPPMKGLAHELLGQYRLNEALARPFDSTVSVAKLIASGVFDRYPGLQVMVVHVGGALTSLIGRLHFNAQLNYKGIADPPRDKTYKNLRAPESYFRTNLLVDIMGFDLPAVKAAISLLGADRVLFGTDFGPVPYGIMEHVEIVGAAATSEAEAAAVLSGNAERLFKLGPP